MQVSPQERRVYIKCAYVAAGKPNAAAFIDGRDGLAYQIMRKNRRLFPSRNSVQNIILPVLKALAAAEESDMDYDGSRQSGSGGHNRKMDIANARFDNSMAVGVAWTGFIRALSRSWKRKEFSFRRRKRTGSEHRVRIWVLFIRTQRKR